MGVSNINSVKFHRAFNKEFSFYIIRLNLLVSLSSSIHLIMTFTSYIFIFIIVSEFVNVLTEKCNYVENQSHHLELSRHLFCDYDGSERPVENFMNATNVSLYISPSFAQFVSEL